MEIKHIKVRDNNISYALSRNDHQILNIVGSSVKFEIEEMIQEVICKIKTMLNCKRNSIKLK